MRGSCLTALPTAFRRCIRARRIRAVVPAGVVGDSCHAAGRRGGRDGVQGLGLEVSDGTECPGLGRRLLRLAQSSVVETWAACVPVSGALACVVILLLLLLLLRLLPVWVR